jgi:hypothetical protein
MKTRIVFACLSGWVGLMVRPALVSACSVCLTGSNDPTVDAFNSSVIFLMATPYLVVGSIAGWLVYSYRRATKKREQTEAAQCLMPLTVTQEETVR